MNPRSYSSLFDVWSRTSEKMFTSIIEANRATMAAFTMTSAEDGVSQTDDRVEARIGPAENLPGWDVDRDTGDEVEVGDAVHFSKTLTEDDVVRFAAASGDTNPIHLDEAWAQQTRFNGRIVHGILVTGLISAALARLPGSVVYLSQDVEFRAPVRIDDRITATVEVAEDLGGERYRLRTTVEKDETLVIDGEAVVLIDEAPDA